MSDKSDSETQVTPTKEKKPKRTVSEAHRAKLKANLEAARVARVAKIAERKAGKNEDEIALKELIAEKKKEKIFGIQDDEPAPAKAPKPSKSKKTKKKTAEQFSSSESEQSEQSEQSELEEESEEEESEKEESASESSDDEEAEYVLKRTKATKPKAAKKPPVKKEKGTRKAVSSAKAEKESILAKMERMTAEIKALKKEKKQGKVNVYVNQPEKDKMTAQQRINLFDL